MRPQVPVGLAKAKTVPFVFVVVPDEVTAAVKFVALFVMVGRAYELPTGSVNPEPSVEGVVVERPGNHEAGAQVVAPPPNWESAMARSRLSVAPTRTPPHS